jgi:hypothetical protein
MLHINERLINDWGRSVSMVASYKLDYQGSITSTAESFSLLQCADWLGGSPSLLSSGFWGPSSGVKKPECKADH